MSDLTKVFEVLGCRACGKCCKNKVKHCAPGEAGGIDAGPQGKFGDVWVIDSLDDGTCKQLVEESDNSTSCKVHGDDNYPLTCKHYPFMVSSYEPESLFISVTCPNFHKLVTKSIESKQFNTDLGKVKRELLMDVLNSDIYRKHYNKLIYCNSVRVEVIC